MSDKVHISPEYAQAHFREHGAIQQIAETIEQRCDQIEAQLETLKATVALLLLDNNMPIKAKQVRDL